MLEPRTVYNVVPSPSFDDIEKARAVERHFAITERLARRNKAKPVVAGQDPFEEPGFTAAPPVGANRNYKIPSRLLLFCAKERYTVVDFIPTFGGALMYDHWIIGGAIVLAGMVAKWHFTKQIESYR